jgi:hypothetical protein
MLTVYILGGIAAALALLVVIVALQPAHFRVARSATMAAPPDEPFGLVNDFHNWTAWSPWEKLDPAMKRTYDGPSAGEGASYAWNGNNNVGEGRSTITLSRPHELIRIKLEFLRPFAATNDVEFTFEPQGAQTLVTWSMTGRKNFMAKAVHLLMNIDKICGGQFEEGLANMKAVVEAPTAASQATASRAP